MKITPQQLQIQLQSLKQDQVSSANVKVGDVLKALILKIEPGQLTLALNDKTTLTAKVQDSARFVLGETVNFQVQESKEKFIKVEVFHHEIKAQISQSAKESLPLLKVEITPEAIKAFEVLKTLDLPVTKDHILTLTQNFKSLNIIHEEINSMYIKTPTATGDELLNQFAKALSLTDKSQVLQAPIKEVAIESLILEKPGVESKQSENVLVENKQSENFLAETKRSPSSDLIKSALGLVVDQNNHQLPLEDTLVKLSQLIQMDKPITLNSLSLLDKLNFEFNLEAQLNELTKVLENMPKLDKPKLMTLLKGFDINQLKSSQDVQSYFKVLLSELEDVKLLMHEKTKDPVMVLKNSIKFLEQDQPQVHWVQVPVQLNDTIRNMDLFVKENFQNKQNSNQKTKILISLNTNHMALVQAFIEVQQKSLKVSIKVANDQVKTWFNKNIQELKNLLIEDKEIVEIVVSSQEYMSYTDFVENENQDIFNMKV